MYRISYKDQVAKTATPAGVLPPAMHGVGREAQNTGAIMCLQAQRKLGWMLNPEQTLRDKGGRPPGNSLHNAMSLTPYQEILRQNNIEPTASHRWQRLGEIPEGGGVKILIRCEKWGDFIPPLALEVAQNGIYFYT